MTSKLYCWATIPVPAVFNDRIMGSRFQPSVFGIGTAVDRQTPIDRYRTPVTVFVAFPERFCGDRSFTPPTSETNCSVSVQLLLVQATNESLQQLILTLDGLLRKFKESSDADHIQHRFDGIYIGGFD